MYKPGDRILYGRTGVCTVEEIVERVPNGGREPRLFYSLRPCYQSCSIFIPVEGGAFSRSIVSPEEARALLDELPAMEAEPYHNRNLNQLRDYYKRRIESFDCRELAMTIVSIHRKRRQAEAQRRKLGAVDERFLREMEELLFGELAAALDCDRAELAKRACAMISGGNEK